MIKVKQFKQETYNSLICVLYNNENKYDIHDIQHNYRLLTLDRLISNMAWLNMFVYAEPTLNLGHWYHSTT